MLLTSRTDTLARQMSKCCTCEATPQQKGNVHTSTIKLIASDSMLQIDPQAVNKLESLVSGARAVP